MKNNYRLSGTAAWLLCFTLLSMNAAREVRGAGTVTSCDEASLRAALAGGGSVTFATDGKITLSDTLTITQDTTLDATGHTITLSGAGTVRVLMVQSSSKLTLKRLTIADGYSSGGLGGGLLNLGDTTVADCTFSNNLVANGPVFGGAINHAGTKLTVTGTTFVGNNAGTSGGAISCGLPSGLSANGDIAITNCTFFANGAQAISIGEPLLNPVTIVNCTFAWNTNAAVRHGTTGFYPGAAQVRLLNSIVANTVGGEGAQGVVDWGSNLSSDTSASLTNTTSLKNVDPLLGPLADNGGPTRTMALLAGSPALDMIRIPALPATDQRGVSRPVGFNNDIGAFEGSANPLYPSTFRFIATNYTVGEGQATALVQVERTGISQGIVSVVFSARSDTASAGADFVPANMKLTFASGEMQKAVPVTILEDLEPEGTETVALSLHDPVGAVLDQPNTATLTIIDNEQSQTVTNWDDASLRAAISPGGLIQFVGDGTILLTNTIAISQPTILDANGHTVVISGGDQYRIFSVGPGASLTLKGLTLVNGRDTGSAGTAGVVGGEGRGGAILVSGGTLNLFKCQFWTNAALGGAGAPGETASATAGGPGAGGAIYNNGGTVCASECTFRNNNAQGGAGGTSWGFSAPGSGGPGQGGAVFNLDGQILLTNCLFRENCALGGEGGKGASLSSGGDSAGGALCSTGIKVLMQDCLVSGNQSISGSGVRLGNGLASAGALQMSGGDLLLFSSVFTENNCRSPWRNTARGGALTQTGGTLAITDSLFLSNSVTGGDGPSISTPLGLPGATALGGALCLVSGSAGITNSSIVRNLALGGSQISGNTPGAGLGGGVYSLASIRLVNSTVTANIAQSGDNGPTGMQGGSYGGGLYNSGGTMQLYQVTIAENAAAPANTNGFFKLPPVALGGGIHSTNGPVSLLNTILANNLFGSNLFGAVLDQGHNLSSDSSCQFASPGSLNNTDAKLGPLDNYGGSTLTMPLLAGSPAIDGGDSSSFLPTDQRGRTRPYGSAPDIGAFESAPPYVIRGRISGFTFKGEIPVSVDAITVSTTNQGRYSLEGLAAGSYTVTPDSANYLCLPTNRSVTVGPDQLGVDFKAYRWNALSLEAATNSMLHLVFAGTKGLPYRVLESTDLVGWSPIATNTIGSSNYFELFVPTTGSGAHLFRTVTP